ADESNVILKLIEDEFADNRSLGNDDHDDNGGVPTGSQPLAALVGDYDPSAPLALNFDGRGFDGGGFDAGDLSPAPTGPGEADPTPVPAPGSAPMRVEPDESLAGKQPGSSGRGQGPTPSTGMGIL